MLGAAVAAQRWRSHPVWGPLPRTCVCTRAPHALHPCPTLCCRTAWLLEGSIFDDVLGPLPPAMRQNA